MTSEKRQSTEAQYPYVGAILIQSANAEELAEFYAAGLRLAPPKPVGEHHIGLMVGGTFLGIEKVRSQPKNDEPSTTVWFQVEDSTSTYDRFVELGAKEKTPPTYQPWGETLAEVVDPEGNVIGLISKAVSEKS